MKRGVGCPTPLFSKHVIKFDPDMFRTYITMQVITQPLIFTSRCVISSQTGTWSGRPCLRMLFAVRFIHLTRTQKAKTV